METNKTNDGIKREKCNKCGKEELLFDVLSCDDCGKPACDDCADLIDGERKHKKENGLFNFRF